MAFSPCWHRVVQRLLRRRGCAPSWTGVERAPMHLKPSTSLAIGRVGSTSIRCSPASGSGTSELCQFLGGSAGTSPWPRLGTAMRGALISRVGDDPFGRFVRRSLEQHGVDRLCRHGPATADAGHLLRTLPRTTSPSISIASPTAPDLRIGPGEIAPVAVQESPAALGHPDRTVGRADRTAHVTAWDLRESLSAASPSGPLGTVIDLDYRPMFWITPGDATRAAEVALAASTVAIGNREECGDRGRRDRAGSGGGGAAGAGRRVGDRQAGATRSPGRHR